MSDVVNKALDSTHPYSALDGKVGAFTEDRKFFVTTPNFPVIYKPFFGPREIYLRQDYRLGPEDPLLYPQPFLPLRCHWAAIPRRPYENTNPLKKWWAALPPEAFVEETDCAVKGLGRWKSSYVSDYTKDCDRIHERVSSYRESRGSAKVNTVVTGLDGQLARTLRHLTSVPLPLHRARQLWSFFQRWYLELRAALDWIEIFQPIMDGRVPPSPSTSERAEQCMGAFLTSVKDCEFFYKAGIPFWLVRSSEHHSTVRIDKASELTSPESKGICLDDLMSHPRVVLYKGPLRELHRAEAVEKYGMAIVDYANDPFSIPADDSSSAEPPDPSSAGPSRAKNKQTRRREPYDKSKSKSKAVADKSKSKTVAQPQVERDKFEEIRGPYSPEVPDVWVDALRSIDRSRRPTKAQVVNGGYAFPDPGMILFPPREKRERLLLNWLQLRPVLTLRQTMDPCLASSAWSAKQWRIVLGTNDEVAAKPGSHMAAKRQDLQALLDQCLKLYQLKLVKNNSMMFTWRDQRYGIGLLSDPPLVKMIIWELFELNFRFEFHALDHKIRGLKPALPSGGVGDANAFNDAVAKCFPTGITCPSEVDFTKANRGLAAAQLRHRGTYFRKMCIVMKEWPGGLHAESFLGGKENLKDYSDEELLAMETWATKFYCQCFYENFGRPPIIPHRVDA
ncbi:hypothetical protein V5O48_016436 [Marasmius crinis-equi]|uniref:Uncharacterized protein n=1 Tax=Marasmius crinis-equi TaxID=585013 RepID=A0ABR3ERS4_9AGAR